jgi:uncharacterized membrane protein
MAWRWQLEGQRLKGVLLQHLVLGAAACVLIWVVWCIHFRARRHARNLSNYRLPLEAAVAVLVALTAHLGGFLSGVNTPV